jgi:hypothetical protein
LDHFFKVLGAEDDVGELLGAEHLGEFRFVAIVAVKVSVVLYFVCVLK